MARLPSQPDRTRNTQSDHRSAMMREKQRGGTYTNPYHQKCGDFSGPGKDSHNHKRGCFRHHVRVEEQPARIGAQLHDPRTYLPNAEPLSQSDGGRNCDTAGPSVKYPAQIRQSRTKSKSQRDDEEDRYFIRAIEPKRCPRERQCRVAEKRDADPVQHRHPHADDQRQAAEQHRHPQRPPRIPCQRQIRDRHQEREERGARTSGRPEFHHAAPVRSSACCRRYPAARPRCRCGRTFRYSRSPA